MQRSTITYKGFNVFEKVVIPMVFGKVPKEFHGQESCFIFFEQGAVVMTDPEHQREFNQGDTMLAKCYDFFMEVPEGKKDPNKVVEMIGVVLNKEIVEDLFSFDIADYNYQVNFNVHQEPVDALLDNFKRSIVILLDNPELADDLMIANKIKEFVLLLSKKHNAPSEQDFLAGLLTSPTFDFRQTIAQNLFINMSLDELAHLCSMSLSSFKRKFAEEYDESPKSYINLKRMEKAKELLKVTDQRVAEIAFNCGFESLSAFNRNFKNSEGFSPSDYRNQA